MVKLLTEEDTTDGLLIDLITEEDKVVVLVFEEVLPNKRGSLVLVDVTKSKFPDDVTKLLALVVSKENIGKSVLADPKLGVDEAVF